MMMMMIIIIIIMISIFTILTNMIMMNHNDLCINSFLMPSKFMALWQEIDTDKLMEPVVLPDMGIWHPSLCRGSAVICLGKTAAQKIDL